VSTAQRNGAACAAIAAVFDVQPTPFAGRLTRAVGLILISQGGTLSTDFTSTSRRLGLYAAIATALLIVAYAITLSIGLASLKSPHDQIGEPMFTMLEILIIAMMPAMVAVMVAVHAWAPAKVKSLSLIAVIFMSLVAALTCTLHFTVLTISHQPVFAEQPWASLFFSFTWPSLAYAIDITAWDIFFPISILFAAMVFSGSRLANWVRWTMVVSGILSFAGLLGVAYSNMQLRNIGIVGYVGIFLVADVLLVFLFQEQEAYEAF
jgi:hypothetical protein